MWLGGGSIFIKSHKTFETFLIITAFYYCCFIWFELQKRRRNVGRKTASRSLASFTELYSSTLSRKPVELERSTSLHSGETLFSIRFGHSSFSKYSVLSSVAGRSYAVGDSFITRPAQATQQWRLPTPKIIGQKSDIGKRQQLIWRGRCLWSDVLHGVTEISYCTACDMSNIGNR